MKKNKPEINCIPNGPYQFTNGEVVNSKGEVRSEKNKVFLCRCGGSSNKPFCDGTHLSNNFSDEKLTNGEFNKLDYYSGKDITIHDNRGICAHSGVCTDNLKEVFKLGQEPWIDPDGSSAEKIAEIINKCPSGALSYSFNDDKPDFPFRSPKITVTKNGSYAVSGNIELCEKEKGEGASDEHFTLCRCGGSHNKPFCDGTHWKNNFTDDKN